MYVTPFCMGPLNSPYAKFGVEMTFDVVNMRVMCRMGSKVLCLIDEGTSFLFELPALRRQAVGTWGADVAGVEKPTFMCTKGPKETGRTNNWVDPVRLHGRTRHVRDSILHGATWSTLLQMRW